jgi:uncharacterized SAM-binding protein YcdF (DUF218 family)
VCALFATALFAWPPLAWVASGSLEWWYAPPAAPPATAAVDAIVVLSGYVTKSDGMPPIPLLAEDTYVRCRHAAWLYEHWRQLPILVCGGKGRAAAMREELLSCGVPSEHILLEKESTSTYENARLGAHVLREQDIKRIALVTEAHHMLRAELCFRRQGLDVIPAPCGFRSARFVLWPGMFLPSGGAIAENEETLHEWVGVVWYWLRGRI